MNVSRNLHTPIVSLWVPAGPKGAGENEESRHPSYGS